MTTQRKYGLAIVTNPYATVCLIVVDGEGRPVLRRQGVFSGRWDRRDNPIFNGTALFAETYDPHSVGGTYDTDRYTMVDATPRGWEEAVRLAMACPRGTHCDPSITADQARGLVAAALATV